MKLPYGIANFEKIRTEGYFYVDKTRYIKLLEEQAESSEKLAMWQDLVEGKIERLIELTERLLKGLSNRDYQQFDEKYIKVVMLSLLSDVNIYIPHSEYEVCANGYVDLYLQAAFEPERSAHYFFELKYVKAHATKHTQQAKEEEGRKQLHAYRRSDAAQNIPNLHTYLLVFRKDHCVRIIPNP